MPAQNRQEVIGAWNEICGTFQFGMTTGSATSTDTMGSVYSGGDFATDCPAFMSGIAQKVQAAIPANPRQDDLVSAVIDDPTWY